ncbi:HlyD family secretion protein [Bdellovibrio sp. ZAP7]|uniref:HlyD family secretion protein n=1 Tax=Bdellovibrio sp. ZAP7 TaxID=2231053 RepID=UPI00115AE2E6|nr:HlyD family secretion protein [Bdellovibrio sp. ZAP7]QDK46751.1 HlyD family secretion protein [Bdellovibrio sp. ZAP7]
MTNIKNNKKQIMIGAGAALVVAGAVFGYYEWSHVSTDNAQIQAHTLMLSSKVPGIVVEVLVQDNDPVKEGQVLARIDSQDYKNNVKQAEADLDGVKAKLHDAEANYKRMADLLRQNVVSRAQYDNAEATFREISKKVQAIQAQVSTAQLNASYTEIKAPSDGRIARKSVEPGMVIPPGQPLFGFVADSSRWVIANFKETEITNIEKGKYVKVEVDALPGQEFHGEVDSLSPSTGAVFSLLPPDNATGNFTKVVQRVPVKIMLKDLTPKDIEKLQAGLSANVSVKVR